MLGGDVGFNSVSPILTRYVIWDKILSHFSLQSPYLLITDNSNTYYYWRYQDYYEG